ncbi:hypothetical protein F0562_003846 [Nyssa sinensis]|uniref:Uncharacterized protein n=1 Tax=Nyssa sinensis TaxID=561372 RepID=A0A5J5BZG5_9ASTE|nr:hypothetical protein F0562_003846 [Nyssa sinensis]
MLVQGKTDSAETNDQDLIQIWGLSLHLCSDDEWKFKDGHVMLTNGIDSRSGDVVVLENDGDFEGVLGATGFGNLQQVELLQNLMRIRDVDWVSLDAIEASSIGRFIFVVDFEIEGGRLLF